MRSALSVAEDWLRAAASKYASGDHRAAAVLCRGLAAAEPANADAHNLLGCLDLLAATDLRAVGRLRRATATGTADASCHANLAAALNRLFIDGEAIRAARRALALHPSLSDAHLHFGQAVQRTLALAPAIAAFRRAGSIDPGLLQARELLAEALLLDGSFEEGAAAFFRYQASHRTWAESLRLDPGLRALPSSGSVTLVNDARLGDALQFVRYAVPLAARGLTVTVECQPELQRLLARARGVARVVPFQTPRDDSTVIPMHMLMHLLADEWPRIGTTVPYLDAEPTRAVVWRERLATAPGFKVGLVWAGRADGRDDPLRSPGLNAFAPIFDVSGISLFGLQLGDGRSSLGSSPLARRLTDLGLMLTDLTETAAALSALDLLVTSDTSMAHLAGALGRPVWMVPPYAPSWRWLLGRDDTPWYPTMRLFRPDAPKAWAGAMRRIAGALSAAD